MALASVLAMIACLAATAIAQDVKMMSPEELNALLGSPDLVIVDVRNPHDWNSSDLKIEGAVREDLSKISEWMGKYPKDKNKKILFYCA